MRRVSGKNSLLNMKVIVRFENARESKIIPINDVKLYKTYFNLWTCMYTIHHIIYYIGDTIIIWKKYYDNYHFLF